VVLDERSTHVTDQLQRRARPGNGQVKGALLIAPFDTMAER
jgi:predicted alpha/beta hydrolase family esterase